MDNSVSKIEKAILDTLIYFDIFNFPLTSFEIWKNLYSKEKCELWEVIKTLNESEFLKTKLEQRESLYFLKGKEENIQKRKDNYIHTHYKYKKGLKFIKLISCFDCIKSIFIVNSMAIDNAKDGSDIDLFVITQKNKIWIARFISVLLAKMLRLRPNEETKKDKICLTIFLDEQDLNLKRVCANNDIYYIYWINQVVPIYDNGIYKDFIKQNSWSTENIQNIFEYNVGYKRKIEDKKIKKTQRKISKIFSFNFLNKLSKKIQLKIFPKEIKEKIYTDSEDVVVNDTIIKLHNNNNRQYFQDLFITRTNE